MTTPVNCPNCGGQLPPSAPACARCGQRFDVEPEPADDAAPAASALPAKRQRTSAELPPRPASVARPGGSAQQFSLSAYLAGTRERWALTPTPFLLAVIALTGIAIVIGTIAHISYLTADPTEIDKQLNDGVWLTTAGALALGALVVAILIRFDAPGLPAPAHIESADFRIGVVLAAMTALFAFVGTVIGMGGRFDAAASWERYASMFAFITVAWFALSRPVPEMIGVLKATNVGLIVGVVALVMLFIGQIQGLSNNSDSYISGVSWQAMAVAVIIIDLGWFLGLQPKTK